VDVVTSQPAGFLMFAAGFLMFAADGTSTNVKHYSSELLVLEVFLKRQFADGCRNQINF
jgi:hypothetical protein